MNPTGTHLLVDLYGVETAEQSKPSGILHQLANLAECKVVHGMEHGFDGGGMTAFLILSQSHTSIHTWPEEKYVAIDLYSCKKLEKEAISVIRRMLKREFCPERIRMRVIVRGDAVRKAV